MGAPGTEACRIGRILPPRESARTANYIVVIEHVHPYYLPDDDYCFGRLLAKDPADFRLILEEPNLPISKVDEKLLTGEHAGYR